MSEPIWSELAGTPLSCPTLTGEVFAEVTVVGLGGSGLTAIEVLVQRGVNVVGVDVGDVAAGAAGRNGGFLLAGLATFHHVAVERLGRERASRCYRATLTELDRIYQGSPAATTRSGSLRIAASDEEVADCRQQLAAMRADGLPASWYEGPEGQGLSLPEDGAMQPALRCTQRVRRAFEAGARLFTHSRVTSLEPGGVVTDSGAVRCRSTLVCVDGALESVVPALVGAVRSARLQMLATEPMPSHTIRCPVYRRFGLDYWQQLDTGEILLGGARDVGGEAEWTTTAEPSAPVQAALDEMLRALVPGAPPVSHRWAGVAGFTDSGMPVVRQLAPDLYVAGGYSGTGNVIGALAGRALVELALDGRSELATLLDGGDS